MNDPVASRSWSAKIKHDGIVARGVKAEFNMITRIWHGATLASRSDEYLKLMRTVAIPDYRSTPGNQGAYALRRIDGETAHFLMVTFWESEESIRAFAGDDISVAKYYDFDKGFLLELELCSTHYEMYDS